MKLRFLGTGTSFGIPRIGCRCGVCRSDDPRNRRLRASVLIETEAGKRVLVDTTPDLRQQLLAADCDHLDLVIITHFHADHVFGMDDLRALTPHDRDPLPVLAHPELDRFFDGAFGYIFNQKAPRPGLPWMKLHALADDAVTSLAGVDVLAFPLPHGRFITRGLRFGELAYLTDCNDVPDAALPHLEGLDILILDMLQPWPHPTHLHLERSLELAARIGARETWFTHMGHDIDHGPVDTDLPDGIHLAWDGLELETRPRS